MEKSLECSGNKMYVLKMKKKALDFVAGERSRVWQRDYCRGDAGGGEGPESGAVGGGLPGDAGR